MLFLSLLTYKSVIFFYNILISDVRLKTNLCNIYDSRASLQITTKNLVLVFTVFQKYPNFHDKTKEVGFFRNWPNFRVRENPMRHVLPVRSCLEFQIHKYFQVCLILIY